MRKGEIKHINLKTIKDPSFLKDLSYHELNILSDDISKHIIDVVSQNGGHLASNLGVVDATIAMCRAFDFLQDKLIFDVGHQCYTYKLLTGRSLDKLRQKDGTAGFQDIKESSFDHFEAGHSSTSISAGLGMAIARDLNKEKYHVVSFIGDASIGNGLALEAINHAGHTKHKLIIVINDNNMSISKPVGGLAKAFRRFSTSSFYRKSKHFFRRVFCWNSVGTKMYEWGVSLKNWIKRHVLKITIFDSMGFSIIGPIDGHNIKSMEKAFLRAKRTEKSVIVFLQTTKGKGYRFAEEDNDGVWHGVHKFNPETGEQYYSKGVSWSKIFGDLVLQEMERNEKAITIVPATEYGSHLLDVFKKFPKRSFDVGIAEEHAITLAAGLSISGYHPIVSIYSTFLQRAYDEVSHDLARMNLDATILIDRSGFVGNDGNSHQGIYDESFLMDIPNTVVCMPSTPEQAVALFNESFHHHGVFCIRYGKIRLYDFNEMKDIPNLSFGRWIKEMQGDNIAIVSVGPITTRLKNKIEELNINVSLYNAIYQKPMDQAAINDLLHYSKIIIYDAYAIENGFPHSLVTALNGKGYQGKIVIKSIPDEFIDHATVKEQLEQYKLTIDDIVELIS